MTIIDVNDHSPQFDNLPYEFNIEENNKVNQLVGHITATDQDSGRNAELQYSIIAGNDAVQYSLLLYLTLTHVYIVI